MEERKERGKRTKKVGSELQLGLKPKSLKSRFLHPCSQRITGRSLERSAGGFVTVRSGEGPKGRVCPSRRGVGPSVLGVSEPTEGTRRGRGRCPKSGRYGTTKDGRGFPGRENSRTLRGTWEVQDRLGTGRNPELGCRKRRSRRDWRERICRYMKQNPQTMFPPDRRRGSCRLGYLTGPHFS